eukprot:496197_1
MLYIFYLKMFEIQEIQSNRSWLSPISVGTEFDVSEKENPFKEIYEKYKHMNMVNKRKTLEMTWDIILGNGNKEWQKYFSTKVQFIVLQSNPPQLAISPVNKINKQMSSTLQHEMQSFEFIWHKLDPTRINHLGVNRFGQKVWLLKFCMKVASDLNKMHGIKNRDLAQIYKDANLDNQPLNDMMVLNTTQCVVM